MSLRLLDGEELEDEARVAGEVEAMWLEYNALTSTIYPTDVPDRIMNRRWELAGLIASTPAETLHECIAKAKLLRSYEKEGSFPRSDGPVGRLAHGLHDDLKRFLSRQ